MFTVGRVWSHNPNPQQPAGSALVDATARNQLIEGFGSTLYLPQVYLSAWGGVADNFYRTDLPGAIGQSIVNVAMGVDGTGSGWPLYNDTGFNITTGDFSCEYQAYKRGVRTFIGRCWTAQYQAPWSWQVGGSQNGAFIAG